MSFIEGVGGAFIFSPEPARLAKWYTENLGLSFDGGGESGAYYQVFWTLDPDDPSRRIDTTFSIIRAKTDFPSYGSSTEPDDMYGDQPFMVNLRVKDLPALLDRLRSNGVRVIKQQDEEYGLFAWVRDADGNRVELYQPLSASA